MHEKMRETSLGFLCHYAVRLSGGQPQLYIYVFAALKWTNDMKLQVLATKQKANAYNEHKFHSNL